jgi:hypothetical protein
MASEINVSALTINAEEARLVSEIVAPLVYSNPDFLKYHDLITGIDKKTQIVLDNGGGRAGWADANCTAVESGGMGITFSQLFWELVTIGDQMIHCQADLDQNFKMTVKKFARDHKDISASSDLLNYIVARLERFIYESMQRLTLLGDKDIDNVTDNGYLKDAIDVKFYNPLNGLWKQGVTLVGAGTTPRFTIGANSQATKALQMSVMTPANAFAAIKGVYDAASDLLKSDPAAYMRVTPALYHAYKAYLMSSTLTGGGLSEMTINGVTTVAYAGIPIYNDLFFGQLILSDFEISDGGSPEVITYNLPHRIIMTTPANVPVATLSESDIKSIESFYYQKDRTNYFRFIYDVDVKVLRGELLVLGY